ncbi:MAG: hypothetical protein WCE21_03145 [Candidatus Babeliales bacterium]
MCAFASASLFGAEQKRDQDKINRQITRVNGGTGRVKTDQGFSFEKNPLNKIAKKVKSDGDHDTAISKYAVFNKIVTKSQSKASSKSNGPSFFLSDSELQTIKGKNKQIFTSAPELHSLEPQFNYSLLDGDTSYKEAGEYEESTIDKKRKLIISYIAEHKGRKISELLSQCTEFEINELLAPGIGMQGTSMLHELIKNFIQSEEQLKSCMAGIQAIMKYGDVKDVLAFKDQNQDMPTDLILHRNPQYPSLSNPLYDGLRWLCKNPTARGSYNWHPVFTAWGLMASHSHDFSNNRITQPEYYYQ